MTAARLWRSMRSRGSCLGAAALLMALALGAFAQAPAAPPADARQLYEAGRFAEAAARFAEEAAREPLDPWTHYNEGNALFRSNQLGRAIAAYLRAWELEPRDEDIRFNLDFALKRAGDGLYPPGMPQAAFVMFHVLSAKEAEGLSWVFWWAFFLLAAFYALAEDKREALAPFMAGAACIWIVTAVWWALLASSRPEPMAVTVAPRTELRNGPGDNFSVGFTAPEGRRVRVLQEREGWVEVGELKEGVKGWVRVENLEKV